MDPRKMVALIALLPVVMLTAPHIASADISGRQLKITTLKAYKYQGFSPLDVLVQVTDEYGTVVNDAIVMIEYGMPSGQDKVIQNLGKGTYVGCDVVKLHTLANGLIVTATASRKGMRPANAKVATVEGNLCGDDAAQPQLVAQQITAAKLDGKAQALDVAILLTDEKGRPVSGAKVMVRATDFNAHVDAKLVDQGNGIYRACAIGLFDTKGAGAISLHINAQRPGYLASDTDAQNVVGSLCSGVNPAPPPNTQLQENGLSRSNAAAAGLTAAGAKTAAPGATTYYFNFEETVKPWVPATDTREATALVLTKGDDGCSDSGHSFALLQSFHASGDSPRAAQPAGIPLPIGTWIHAQLPSINAPTTVHFDLVASSQSKSCEGCLLGVYAGTQRAVMAGQLRPIGTIPSQGWQTYHADVAVANSSRGDALYVAIGWFGYDATLGIDCVNIVVKPEK